MTATGAEWSTSDDFWEGLVDLMFDRDRIARAPAEVDRIESLLSLSNARIVDLCCGTGRHSVELARRGHEVIGVDRTRHYLDLADKAAAEEAVAMETVCADARDYRCSPAADVVLNLWTSFGYFEHEGDNVALLRAAYESLRDGGRLLLQTRAKETMSATMVSSTWWERDGVLFLEEREVIDDWRRLSGRWIVVDDNGRRDFTYTGWLYSSEALTAMLEKVGFRSVALYGDLAGSPFDLTARHLVAVATR